MHGVGFNEGLIMYAWMLDVDEKMIMYARGIHNHEHVFV